MLLQKVVEGKLADSDLPLIEQMTPEFGAVGVRQGVVVESAADLRKYYDPNLDIDDGVLDDFPNNCVEQVGAFLIVRLPYGKCLRGAVKLPATARLKPS